MFSFIRLNKGTPVQCPLTPLFYHQHQHWQNDKVKTCRTPCRTQSGSGSFSTGKWKCNNDKNVVDSTIHEIAVSFMTILTLRLRQWWTWRWHLWRPKPRIIQDNFDNDAYFETRVSYRIIYNNLTIMTIICSRWQYICSRWHLWRPGSSLLDPAPPCEQRCCGAWVVRWGAEA